MHKIGCMICSKPKAQFQCGSCQTPICKACAEFLEENTFSFLTRIPADLSHSIYCATCFSQNIETALQQYNETLRKAEDILIYDKSQSKETRLLKRLEKPYQVKNASDRNQAIMKMAFWAVQSNFNAVIDVDIVSEKIRNGSYQTTVWHGTGIPTQVIESKIIKDRSFWSMPN